MKRTAGVKVVRHNVVLRLALIGIVALSVSGCVSRSAITKMGEQLDYLEASQRRMERDLIRIDSLTTEANSESRRTRAEVTTTLEEFQDGTRTMRESIEELRRTMERRPPRVVYRDRPVDTSSSDEETALGHNDGEADTGPPPDIDPSRLYESAFLDVRKGNYELAIDQFRDVLTYFGDTEYAPNARYWIGECWYSLAGTASGLEKEEQYDSAIVEFEYLVSNHPASNRVPTALYKLGRCFEEMRRPRRARSYYDRVVGEFPKSLEAKPAQGRLDDLR